MERILLGTLCLVLLGGCALGQDVYDERQLDECRELPTPNERLDCERTVRDGFTDRRHE